MMMDFVIYCSIVCVCFLFVSVVSPEEGAVVLNLNCFQTARKALVNIVDFMHVTVGLNCVTIT
jgi:hypothetical protein